MLISAGKGRTVVKEETPTNLVCTDCGKSGTTTISFAADYVHFYGIPLAPDRKRVFTHCKSCGFEMNEETLPQPLKAAAMNAKMQIKTPVKHFTGLILFFLVFFGFLAINIVVESGLNADYIKPGLCIRDRNEQLKSNKSGSFTREA